MSRLSMVAILLCALCSFFAIRVQAADVFGTAAPVKRRKSAVSASGDIVLLQSPMALARLSSTRVHNVENEEDVPDHEVHEDHEEHAEDDQDADELEDSQLLHVNAPDHVQIDWIKKVGRVADKDGNSRLSASELVSFANEVKSRQQWARSNSSFEVVDRDGSHDISKIEVQEITKYSDHLNERFVAADSDSNGKLDIYEFHAYLYPEHTEAVLAIEAKFQMQKFDLDNNSFISMDEFRLEAQQSDPEDFDEDDAVMDFKIHDLNGDNNLDESELKEFIAGHVFLKHTVEQTISGGDHDSDDHIHLESEVPHALDELMDCEFVEDFFFHEDVKQHVEFEYMHVY